MTPTEPSRSTPTAFVTGATGFLGLNLVAHLTQLGWKVFALHRPQSNLDYLRRFPVERIVGSIEDFADLERVVPSGIDVFFHVAADVSFWSRHRARQTRTNVDGTRNVVEIALRRGVRKFIHTSTTAVYGFAATPFDETAPHLGRDSGCHYMHTKELAEEEVRHGIARGLNAVLLNPANIIGPYDRQNWVRLIRLAAEDRLPAIPPGRGSFCHVAEVAQAHVAAVEHGRTGENYILGGTDASYADVVEAVGELLQRPRRVRPMRVSLFRTAGHVLNCLSWISRREPLLTPESAAFLSADLTCCCARAVRELNYRVVPLSVMLEDCCRWMRAEGLLPGTRSVAVLASGGR